MKVDIQVGGRFHSVMLADTLAELGASVTIYSSAPPKGFSRGKFVHRRHFVPLVASVIQRLSGLPLSQFELAECTWFDRLADLRRSECDVLHGWSGYSLYSGRSAKARGSRFFLERSCPHIDAQEQIIAGEAEKLQVAYLPKPTWWRERSLAEYETADVIVTPSRYTYSSFTARGFSPEKLLLAPLDRPVALGEPRVTGQGEEFTVGCLGGNMLRKGFLYLFSAWDRLKLPKARLLVKAPERDLRHSPVLSALLDGNPNIEIVPYVPNIADFYRRCDLFCMPSVDDGFGLATTEALANSLPVITTQNVGASEILVGEDVGCIVPTFDVDAIAAQLERLYRDRDELGRLSQNALALARRLNAQGSRYEPAIASLYGRTVESKARASGR